MKLGFLTSTVAQAQVPVALDYSAVSGCPDAGYFKAIVIERLGDDAFAETAPNRVLVHIISQLGTYEGRMEWRDLDGNWAGERTFPGRSSDCAVLVRAMAFTLALQLQFSAKAGVPATAGNSAADSEPTAEPLPSLPAPLPADQRLPLSSTQSPTAVTMPAPRPRHPVTVLGAGALIGLGMSSRALPFLRAFGMAAWPSWSLSLATEISIPSTMRRADGAGFSQQLLLLSIAGCRNFEVWSACMLAKAGEIRVAGTDIDVPASDTAPLIQTGLRASATQLIFRRTSVSVYAEALVLPIRWAVTLDQSAVFASRRFTETVGFDVGFHLD